MANFCSECGTALAGSKRFCSECGNPTVDSTATSPTTPPAGAVVPPESIASPAEPGYAAGEDGSPAAAPVVQGEERWFNREAWDDGVPEQQCLKVNGSEIPVSILKAFATEGDYPLRLLAAENSRTPQKYLDSLARDPNVSRIPDAEDPEYANLDILQALAVNPSCPQSTLRYMATHLGALIRTRVADNASAPAKLLAELGRDLTYSSGSGIFPMYAVAGNPATPPEVLRSIADHHIPPDVAALWDGLLGSLGGNPATPEDVLEMLASDPNWSIRSSVASNPATPDRILYLLGRDAEEHVRAPAWQNLAIPKSERAAAVTAATRRQPA